MKNSISIKKIILGVVVALISFATTSCKDYLNIDNYFDDEFNIDSAFVNARYIEAYMWGLRRCFQTNHRLSGLVSLPGQWLPMKDLTG